eukprot:11252972-Alexandrium_andersonii.AAC.1
MKRTHPSRARFLEPPAGGQEGTGVEGPPTHLAPWSHRWALSVRVSLTHEPRAAAKGYRPAPIGQQQRCSSASS